MDSPIVVSQGSLSARHLVLKHDTVHKLWQHIQRHKHTSVDFGSRSPEDFTIIITNPGWLFFEIQERGDMIGVVYFTSVLDPSKSITMHFSFFDGNLSHKAGILRALAEYVLSEYIVHRIEMTLPKEQWAVIRLANRMHFTYEGTLREAGLVKNRWADFSVFSLIQSDVEKAAVESSQDSVKENQPQEA